MRAEVTRRAWIGVSVAALVACAEPAPPSAAAPAPASRVDPAREPDVVFWATPEPVVDKMLELARLEKDDVVYDLGCGDGRIVVGAAKRFGVRAFGFDIDPKRVAEARENARKAGVSKLVTIEQRDIFTLDLSPASVVTLYLLPGLNEKLLPQLRRLRPGARVISHQFPIPGVKPDQTVDVDHPGSSHVLYLWHAPLAGP